MSGQILSKHCEKCCWRKLLSPTNTTEYYCSYCYHNWATRGYTIAECPHWKNCAKEAKKKPKGIFYW